MEGDREDIQCFTLLCCTIRLGTIWAYERNFCMNIAPGARLITVPVCLQSIVLQLPPTDREVHFVLVTL